MSLQFDPKAGLSGPRLGLFWAKIRDRFPNVEEHPPLPRVMEQFGGHEGPSVQVQFFTRPPAPRIWLGNTNSTQAIQVQQDRFIHNWKKQSEADLYPRYPALKGSFLKELDNFRGFLREEGLGEIAPELCEIAYVNQLISGAGWQDYGDIPAISTLISSEAVSSIGLRLEGMDIQSRFLLLGQDESFRGRLYLSLEPAIQKETGTQVFLLKLTVRGRPSGPSTEQVGQFFDEGRMLINNTFVKVTTTQMHKLWGRQ